MERVLQCIDRIGGSNSLDTEALIDDNKSIIGSDAMSQVFFYSLIKTVFNRLILSSISGI